MQAAIEADEYDAARWISTIRDDFILISLDSDDISHLKQLHTIQMLSPAANPIRSVVFQELIGNMCCKHSHEIDGYISKNIETGVFCKMSMKSSKNDSETCLEPKFSSREIFQELSKSRDVIRFLDLFGGQSIVLIPFDKEVATQPQNEFRLFIENNRIMMVSSFVRSVPEEIDFEAIFDPILTRRVKITRYCADVFVPEDRGSHGSHGSHGSPRVIEINPWDRRTGVGRFVSSK